MTSHCLWPDARCKGFDHSGLYVRCSFDKTLLGLTGDVGASHTHCGAVDMPFYMHTRTLAWNNDTALRCTFKRYADDETLEITIDDQRTSKYEKQTFYNVDDAMDVLREKLKDTLVR